MKVSFMTGALAGAIVVIAGGAAAGYHLYETSHMAKVLSATPDAYGQNSEAEMP
jgi:hypothetical protein